MTPAERQQLKRDRRKAGLVCVDVWVPADIADAMYDAMDAAQQGRSDIPGSDDSTNTQGPSGGIPAQSGGVAG